MNYYRDYHTLSQLNAREAAASEFQARLSQFLDEIVVPPAPAKNIAARTCASMQGLKYHSHGHILSIFDWAKAQGLRLEPWQTLALWFHDVIYDPKAPPLHNEEQSAQFVERMLSDDLKPEMLARACEAIRHTARHMEKADFAFPAGVPLLLDLDLCMFAWDRPNYAAAARAVAEEYLTVYSAPDYAKGRKQFLTAFKGKGFIFRTPRMQRYEATAIDNIQWEIANVGYAQKANHRLRAVLADLPVGTDIPSSVAFRDFLAVLEFFIPELLGDTHPEWRQESLDGFYPLVTRKVSEDEIELFGLCILISDQTTTPIHLRMQAALSGEEVQWLECRLGERGDHGMVRTPWQSVEATDRRLHALAGRADRIDWVYKVTFGDRRS